MGVVVENMQEEIIPLIPVLLILVGRLGFTPMVAVAMSAPPTNSESMPTATLSVAGTWSRLTVMLAVPATPPTV